MVGPRSIPARLIVAALSIAVVAPGVFATRVATAADPTPAPSPSPTADPSPSTTSTIPPDGTTAPAPLTTSTSEPAIEGTELIDRRTATSRTTVTADGTLTTEIFPQAIHYQPDGTTSWEPIDLTFAPIAVGSKVAKIDKSPTKVTVAPANDTTGFLVLELGGQQIALKPATPATSAAAPTVDGAQADVPDIAPGVDLRVFASADGVNAFLVLDAPPAQPSFTFLVDAPTLSLSLDKATKRLLFKNAQSVQVGSFLAPYAVDSTPDELTGGGRTTTAVTYSLAKVGGKPAVTVSVDPAWLATATYPVYIDPTIYNDGSNTYGDAHVNQGNPTLNYANYKRPDSPYYYEMWLGESPGQPTYYNEAFIKFDLTSIADTTIDSATIEVRPYHQYYNSPTATNTWLRRVTASWTESGITWNTKPAVASGYVDVTGCVEGTQCGFSVTSLVQGWVSGTYSNYGIRLDENGNGPTYWKNLGGPEPDFGNCDNTHNADPFVVTYCFRDSARGHFTFMYVIGNATTESEVERLDANQNRVPDRVDEIEGALEDAWDVYVNDMGFEDPMPGARINVSLARPPDRDGKVTSFYPIPLPLLMSLNPAIDDDYLFRHLIPHELFHVVQFHYSPPIAILGDERQGWYEATANWGAHELLRQTSQLDPLNRWTGNVGAYLGTSELELSKKSPWGEEREYAMQLVGEYLQMTIGANAVRRTWELIRDGKTAKEAIRDTVNEAPDPVLPFGPAWLDYAQRAYEMDFPGLDQQMMRDKLAEYMTFDKSLHSVPDPANTNFDDVGSPRPARHRADLALGAQEQGEVPVEELGMGYVDLVPAATPPFSGSITVQVELPDGDVATLVPYRALAGPQPEDIDGPIACGPPQDFTFENGIGTAEVVVDTTCPFATLIVARVAPPAVVAGPAKWTATFTNNIVSNGTVQLGINRAGNLIVPNSVPSSGTLEPQVGLRLLTGANGPLDGISPGCDCEGWGIAASNLAGATAYAQNGSINPVNMTVTEFSKSGQTATSRVLATGIFDVTHQFDPVPGQPHLYRITVTVTNVGVQDANVRYRRVMDWDVEPTAFDEYTTIGHFGDPPASLVYTSNDGFQDADPMDPPTNASATGFYADDGPADWGAMFDFDFGILSPNETLSFELFYGAAPSELIALAELQAVGAQAYSLGQPSSPGGKEFGQPVTFLFGMREIAGGGSLAPQGATAEAKPFNALGEPTGAPPVNRNNE